jgi:transposase
MLQQTVTQQTDGVHPSQVSPPDPEVPERPERRRFSAEYKLAILAETDKASPGEIGAILRREALYSSLLTTWRRQRREGALIQFSQKRGRKPDPLDRENARLRRENEKLRRDLEAARLVIDVQKKVSRLLPVNEPGEES